jgi:Domain of unknown function (DUF4396)
MAPTWLTVVAWVYLLVCFCCAGIIGYDIAVDHRRQPMGVMNFVFPITALYFGPFALAFYWRWGRAAPRTAMPPMSMSRTAGSRAAVVSVGGGRAMGGHADHGLAGAARPGGADQPAPPGRRARPWWVTMAIEVSHCGSGCVLGDVISEFAIFWLALTIAGATLGAEYVGDYVLALAFGILFQYFAIAPMRGLRLKDGLIAAAKSRLHLADRVRGRPVRLDGGHGVRAVPGAAPPHTKLGCPLAAHAGRHDHRVRHFLARGRLAGQPRHQGTYVSQRPECPGPAHRSRQPVYRAVSMTIGENRSVTTAWHRKASSGTI